MHAHQQGRAFTDSIILEMRTSIRSTYLHFETQVLQHDARNGHELQKNLLNIILTQHDADAGNASIQEICTP